MAFNPIFLALSEKHFSIDRYSQPEKKQKFRSDFSKDRDRIMYSKSFRRLSGKTQVFLSTTEDDIRTRLTHTLEVNQIAKTIGSALAMNLNLIEAIALGHDVGHTPFGHVGERTLNLIMNNCEEINGVNVSGDNLGFKHNLQAVRVLCDLENGKYGAGLNLSKYTLWGIANHSSLRYKPCKANANQKCWLTHKPKECTAHSPVKVDYYDRYINQIDNYWSFEGLIVALADEIAQRHHDIEDSLTYNIIERAELLNEINNIFNDVVKRDDKENLKKLNESVNEPLQAFINHFSRFIVNLYVVDAITQTKTNMREFGNEYNISSGEAFAEIKPTILVERARTVVDFSTNMQRADERFKQFLKDSVLGSHSAQRMDGKGQYIIRRIFEAYMSNPCQLPDDVIQSFYNNIGVQGKRSDLKGHVSGNENQLMRTIADYIGGMTDSCAYSQFNLLYGTTTY